MKMFNVASSCFKRVGYNSKEKTMRIKFNSDRLYAYYNVPENVFHELLNADSHGRYFNSHVRNRYGDTKIS